MTYNVIYAEGLAQLRIDVQKYIEDGGTPLGGIAVRGHIFFQAMLKVDKK